MILNNINTMNWKEPICDKRHFIKIPIWILIFYSEKKEEEMLSQQILLNSLTFVIMILF